LWDVATGQSEILTEGDRAINGVAFSPDGQILVAGGYREPRLRILDLDTRTEATRTEATREMPGEGSGITVLAFSPDGEVLAATDRMHSRVVIWDTDSWTVQKEIAGPQRTMAKVAFSPLGDFFVTPTSHQTVAASGESTGTVYDTKTWEKVAVLPGMGEVLDVAFSPDGKTLAVGTHQGEIKLWDVASFRDNSRPRLVGTLFGETSGVHAVAFSLEGTTLVSAGVDSHINFWNLKLGKPALVATLRGHSSGVLCVAFSPDKKTLATASYDSTIRLWRSGP
jgi:Tol biopolymer transport system component